MEINKYKAVAQRMMAEMKRNNIKVPGTRGANLTEPETGLREEAESKPAMGTGAA